jgi:hypothetical protein
LSADALVTRLFEASLNGNGSLFANPLITKFAASSLNTASSLAASALVSKLAASSLTGAGTLVADLTVTAAGFDADAQAFFNRVTTAGGTLTTTEQNAVNTLVIALKADGLWTKMKAIYPMVGASAAACSRNLKSDNFNGTFTAGVTFANTGIKGNGTSSYMDTGINLSIDLNQNNTHVSVYSRSNNQGGFSSFGAYSGSNLNALFLYMYLIGAAYYNIFTDGGNNFFGSATTALRMRILNRINSTTVNYFTNLSKQTVTANSTTGANLNIFLLANNANGIAAQFDVKENAFYSFGDGLTDTEANNFYTRVQAFQTTLSRQV